MTNSCRNVRTLIVCFVLLILALIPLRFVEVRNIRDDYNYQTQVLGETNELGKDKVIVEKVKKVNIILPNAEIDLNDISK